MRYKNAIVIGTGKLPVACALALREQGLSAVIYDGGEAPSDFLRAGAEKENITCIWRRPREVFEELTQTSEMTLLVSAINPWILPRAVVEHPMIMAVNCHQALLPKHPGRNAEMWAIYEGDEKTGVTWHLMETQVDGGAILIQKELPITEKSTSYQVFRQQIALAEEAFREVLPSLLDETVKPYVQDTDGMIYKLHYSKDVPEEGLLDSAWEEEKISRFLRATDYGILQVIPRPQLLLDGERYVWKSYRITEEERFEQGIYREEEAVLIQKPGMLFTLKRCRKVSDGAES